MKSNKDLISKARVEVDPKKPFFEKAAKAALDSLKRVGLQPNFLFLGNSVLHIASLNAFLLKLSDQGINPCGVVCDNIDLSRKSQFDDIDVFAVERSNLVVLRNNKDFVFRKKSMIEEAFNSLFPHFPSQTAKNVTQCKSDSQVFFLLLTNEEYPSLDLWKIASSQGKPIKCVLLEEGVGSYVSQRSTHNFFAKKETLKTKRTFNLIKEQVVTPIREHYRRVSDRKCDIRKFGLLCTGYKGLIPNDDYCFWIREALKKQGEIKGLSKRNFSRKVIIVGTNFSELGSTEVESLFIKKITQIIRSCDFVPYFRPHPRTKDQSVYKYLEDIEISFDNKCPLEAIVSSCDIKPVAIIGLGSSSQLLSSVLWGIPALTVSSILEEAAVEKSMCSPVISAYIERLKLFDRTFNKWFIPVVDDRDLKRKLMSYKSAN